MTVCRFATWNQNAWRRPHWRDRVALIERHADVLCAQELRLRDFKALRDALDPDKWWGRFSLCTVEQPMPRSSWGVAVFGRRSMAPVVGMARALHGHQKDKETYGHGLFWRRTVIVPVTFADGSTCDVASIHVRPGATVSQQKLDFLHNVHDLFMAAGRLVVGVDTNCRGFDLQRPDWFDHEAFGEQWVWGDRATHRLRDTWGERPPEATHYIGKSKVTGARFDQVWATQGFTVSNAGVVRGSMSDELGTDHAMVVSAIDVSQGGPCA